MPNSPRYPDQRSATVDAGSVNLRDGFRATAMSEQDAPGRRELLRILAGAAALVAAEPAGAQTPSPPVPPPLRLQIAMLVYGDMILLDLVGVSSGYV